MDFIQKHIIEILLIRNILSIARVDFSNLRFMDILLLTSCAILLMALVVKIVCPIPDDQKEENP